MTELIYSRNRTAGYRRGWLIRASDGDYVNIDRHSARVGVMTMLLVSRSQAEQVLDFMMENSLGHEVQRHVEQELERTRETADRKLVEWEFQRARTMKSN